MKKLTFKKMWDELEKKFPVPVKANKLKIMDYKNLKNWSKRNKRIL